MTNGLKLAGFIVFGVVLVSIGIFAGLIIGGGLGGIVGGFLGMGFLTFGSILLLAHLSKKWGFGEFEIYPKDYVP